MPTKKFKYTTKSGAVYFQIFSYENDKLIKKSWNRESKKPFDSEIYLAAYVSPALNDSLQKECGLAQKDESGEGLGESLEEIIEKGKAEKYKGLGGNIISLISNNRLAFSTPVIKIERVE